MKSSSADLGRTQTGVLSAAQAGDDRVRPARLDRPLTGSRLDPTYADPQLERAVSRASAGAAEQARALGYAQGWAQGRRAVAEAELADAERRRQVEAAEQAAFAERAASALGALAAAAHQQRETVAATLAEIGEAVADGALALARAALDRELATVDAEVADAVRRALRSLGSAAVSVVRVNPGDLDVLAALPPEVLPEGLRLEADPSVPRGGALAASQARQVLAHLPTALAAAEEVLRG